MPPKYQTQTQNLVVNINGVPMETQDKKTKRRRRRSKTSTSQTLSKGTSLEAGTQQGTVSSGWGTLPAQSIIYGAIPRPTSYPQLTMPMGDYSSANRDVMADVLKKMLMKGIETRKMVETPAGGGFITVEEPEEEGEEAEVLAQQAEEVGEAKVDVNTGLPVRISKILKGYVTRATADVVPKKANFMDRLIALTDEEAEDYEMVINKLKRLLANKRLKTDDREKMLEWFREAGVEI